MLYPFDSRLLRCMFKLELASDVASPSALIRIGINVNANAPRLVNVNVDVDTTPTVFLLMHVSHKWLSEARSAFKGDETTKCQSNRRPGPSN